MSQPFFVLLLLLISLFATDVVHSQTALTTRSLPYCGVSKDKCSRIIELIDLKRDRFVVSFVTGSRSKPTSADSRTYLDSLVGFATKSGAVGVFSAGFYRDPWIAQPFGGFKVNGVLISKVLDYPESSFICEANGNLSITRSSAEFALRETCMQTGPTIYQDGRSPRDLSVEAGGRFNFKLFYRQERRILLVTFESGDAAILVARQHSYSEVQAFLKEISTQDNRVKYAVGLSGGTWSGYIIRTPNSPILVGNTRAAIPNAFLVFQK